MRLILFGCLVMTTLLSGCTSTSFDCKRTDGLNCVSLYEVNDKINTGAIGQNGVKKAPKGRSTLTKGDAQPMTVTTQKTTAPSVKNNKTPIRVPEQTASIVIFPYESDDGVYHQGTVLHTVLSKAHWAG